jgi:hypothetical protein
MAEGKKNHPCRVNQGPRSLPTTPSHPKVGGATPAVPVYPIEMPTLTAVVRTISVMYHSFLVQSRWKPKRGVCEKVVRTKKRKTGGKTKQNQIETATKTITSQIQQKLFLEKYAAQKHTGEIVPLPVVLVYVVMCSVWSRSK